MKDLLIVTGLLVVIGGILVTGGQSINLAVQPQIVAYVEYKEVFKGSAACVNISSEGAATLLTISGGFLCLFPKQHFVSNLVRIETLK